MKRRRNLAFMLAIAAISLLVFSCKKMDDYPMQKIPIKIHFNVDGDEKLVSNTEKNKAEIVNGYVYTIYGVGAICIWETSPLTPINWELTGPNGLDTIMTQQEMIAYQLMDYGTYNLQAYNPPPYGFEWHMTVIVASSLAEQLIVEPTFIRSEWIVSSSTFRYYWRVPKPATLNGTETLFRLTGLSEVVYNPFPAFDSQVYFVGSSLDSIEWYYDYPANGIVPFGAKSNVGYLSSSADSTWLTVDTASDWHCQNPTNNNVVEAIHDNGRVGPIGTTFAIPAGVRTGLGDHGSLIPVILLGTPTVQGLPIYALANPETNVWRYRLSSEVGWTEVSITQSNGRITILLPATNSQRDVQYGYFNDTDFIPDPFMILSGGYNPSVQGFTFFY